MAIGARRGTSNDTGSGSHMLTRYDPAVGFIAKRFAGHFMKSGPKYIDEIEFSTVKEDNTRVLGMIKNETKPLVDPAIYEGGFLFRVGAR